MESMLSSLINTVHNRQLDMVPRSSILVPLFPGVLGATIHGVKYNIETRTYQYKLPDYLVPETSEDCFDTADWLLSMNALRQLEFGRWFDFMRNIGCRDDGTSAKPWKHFISDWSANLTLHRLSREQAPPTLIKEFHIHSTMYLLWTTDLKED